MYLDKFGKIILKQTSVWFEGGVNPYSSGQGQLGFFSRKIMDLQIPQTIWIFLKSLGIMPSSVQTVAWN